MATKKQPAGRGASAKSTAKKSASKTGKKVVKMLYTERKPENHRVTGKFKFFYFFFIGTTLLFAILAVWLFIFSCDLMSKYESIEACARAHTSCTVKFDGTVNPSVEVINNNENGEE